MIVELLQGVLSTPSTGVLEAHIDACSDCRQLVAELARTSIPSTPASEDHSPTLTSLDGSLPSEAPTQRHSTMTAVAEGQILAGRYRVQKLLGRGSMGSVFDAVDLQLKEHVALKLLGPRLKENPRLLSHLHQEIVLGRRITHPNVCRLYDIGACGELHFISMELIKGEPLDRFLARALPTKQVAAHILAQICEALVAAHAQGVVHRDLKPSNIMIGEDHHVTVMDFGLARDLRGAEVSESGMLIGTPAYWAPEQARGERASERSDLYAVGVIASELFGCGRPSFNGSHRLEGVPSTHRAMIQRCLMLDPADRPESAAHAKAAFEGRRLLGASPPLPKAAVRAFAVLAFFGIVVGGAIPLVLAPTPSDVLAEASAIPQPEPTRVEPPRIERIPSIAVGSPEIDADEALVAAVLPRAKSPARARIKPRHRRRAKVASSTARGARAMPSDTERGAERRDATPLEPELSPTTETPRPPDPDLARLASLDVRLSELEADRRARGILVSDMDGYGQKIARARKGLLQGSVSKADSAVADLARTLQATSVDAAFIPKKLSRIDRLSNRADLDAASRARLTKAFARVHDRYFAGDFEAANAHLNEIWRLLHRGGAS